MRWLFVLLLVPLASAQLLRRIQTQRNTFWLTDEQMDILRRRGDRFIDTTDYELRAVHAPSRPKLPKTFSPAREALARALGKEINVQRMRTWLAQFTSFHTRYYKSPHGEQSADWLYAQLEAIAKASPMNVEMRKIAHGRWPQYSIVVQLVPDGDGAKDRVILSSHQDSTAMVLPMLMRAPGADDDGSGVVTLLETFRVLCSRRIALARPVELMFFAAEEGGLLGSQAVAKMYQDAQVPATVLHLDMDGYSGRAKGRTPEIGIINDYTDAALSRFVRRVVRMYTALPIAETACGYACSDHHSWTMAGYPAAALLESRFEHTSPHLHTSRDTVETIDFEHMGEFARIYLAFALHMSDPLAEYD